jgi:hypothetical protein
MGKRTCSFPGCDAPSKTRGLCGTHYQRWWRNGDPSVVLTNRRWEGLTVEDRFWAKVNRRGPDDCWVWTGSTDPRGYGHIWRQGRLVPTHRLSYELNRGPIPDGMCVLHRCDNPPCCNPSHLFLGTKADNAHDMHAKGRAHYQRRLRPPEGSA